MTDAVTSFGNERSPGEGLIQAILGFLEGEERTTLDAIRQELRHEIDEAGPLTLATLRARLAGAAAIYVPPDPLARRIHHRLADRLLLPGSELVAGDCLTVVGNEPAIVFANHLSYSDANVIELLLHRAGADAFADRLTAIAGPKVFSSRTRQFSSLCFGTIRTAQSADVASEEAVASAREIARASKLAIDAAHARLRAGDAIVLFGEGSRSRTAAMQRLLPAVSRYLHPCAWIVPIGLTGTEHLFPVTDVRLHRVPVTARVGQPFRASLLLDAGGRDRSRLVDAIGLSIAALLPEPYRGVYGGEGFDDARAVLASISNK
jgi:1-acyl-sn-glycerol-3-phosphate acyltransferase